MHNQLVFYPGSPAPLIARSETRRVRKDDDYGCFAFQAVVVLSTGKKKPLFCKESNGVQQVTALQGSDVHSFLVGESLIFVRFYKGDAVYFWSYNVFCWEACIAFDVKPYRACLCSFADCVLQIANWSYPIL